MRGSNTHGERFTAEDLVCNSDVMKKVRQEVRLVVDGEDPVLITGEEGNGKRLLARTIHKESPRGKESLLEMDLRQYSVNDFFPTLYGSKARKGFLELTARGSLLIHHIEALNYHIQEDFLKALKDGHYQPVDSQDKQDITTRFLITASADLEDRIEKGTFSEELYQFNSPGEITMPPLRNRKEDIIQLVALFLTDYCGKNSIPRPVIPADVVEMLTYSHWPGNVRRLREVIETNLFLSGEEFELKYLPDDITHDSVLEKFLQGESLPTTTRRIEKKILEAALRKFGGHQVKTARYLGLASEGTLRAKLVRLGVSVVKKKREQ